MFNAIDLAGIGGHTRTERARIGWHGYAVINDGKKKETFGPLWSLTKAGAKRKAERVLEVEFCWQTGSW